MKRTFALLLGTVAACGLPTGPVSEARGEISYTTVDYPGAAETRIHAINDSGAFVGEYRLPGEFWFGAFVYDGNLWRPLDDPAALTDWAEDINNAGVIVGTYTDWNMMSEFGYLIAPPYTSDEWRPIPVPGTNALGISNLGLIVGGLPVGTGPGPGPDPGVGESRGFLCDANDLDANDLNDPNSDSMFFHPGAKWTEAWDVNDSRMIVGDYVYPDDVDDMFGLHKSHGFLYDFDANQWTTLDYPNAESTEARGINEAGQIVGVFRDANDRKHGFLYDGNWTPIDYPDANETWAEGISDSGIIAGSYTDAAGLYHGFTTPEPATALLLAAGFAGGFLGRRRRR